MLLFLNFGIDIVKHFPSVCVRKVFKIVNKL